MARSVYGIFHDIKSDIIDLIDERIKKFFKNYFNYGVTIGSVYLSKKEHYNDIYKIFGNSSYN